MTAGDADEGKNNEKGNRTAAKGQTKRDEATGPVLTPSSLLAFSATGRRLRRKIGCRSSSIQETINSIESNGERIPRQFGDVT